MIINEQALLRVMKEAYKGLGFHVAAYYADGRENVLISGTGWLVTMERQNAPSKVRGYVAEKAGEWPNADEAYLVRKDEVQTEQPRVVLDSLVYFQKMFEENNAEQIKPTQLLMGLTELWQCCGSLEMLLMDPNMTDIIGDSRVPVIRAGETLKAEGTISSVYIVRIRENETTGPILEHLKRLRWVPDK